MTCSSFNNWRSNNSLHGSQVRLLKHPRNSFSKMKLEQGFIESITQGRILNFDDMHSDEILTISTIGVTHPEVSFVTRNVICYQYVSNYMHEQLVKLNSPTFSPPNIPFTYSSVSQNNKQLASQECNLHQKYHTTCM